MRRRRNWNGRANRQHAWPVALALGKKTHDLTPHWFVLVACRRLPTSSSSMSPSVIVVPRSRSLSPLSTFPPTSDLTKRGSQDVRTNTRQRGKRFASTSMMCSAAV
eukprot:scaffold27248_cov133-Isochrysis_galbana.AAC.7